MASRAERKEKGLTIVASYGATNTKVVPTSDWDWLEEVAQQEDVPEEDDIPPPPPPDSEEEEEVPEVPDIRIKPQAAKALTAAQRGENVCTSVIVWVVGPFFNRDKKVQWTADTRAIHLSTSLTQNGVMIPDDVMLVDLNITESDRIELRDMGPDPNAAPAEEPKPAASVVSVTPISPAPKKATAAEEPQPPTPERTASPPQKAASPPPNLNPHGPARMANPGPPVAARSGRGRGIRGAPRGRGGVNPGPPVAPRSGRGNPATAAAAAEQTPVSHEREEKRAMRITTASNFYTAWFVKKGKKRWFLLDVGKSTLFWFEKELPRGKDPKKHCKNMLDLTHYEPFKKHGFNIVLEATKDPKKHKPYEIEANNEKEFEAWFEALVRACPDARVSGGHSSHATHDDHHDKKHHEKPPEKSASTRTSDRKEERVSDSAPSVSLETLQRRAAMWTEATLPDGRVAYINAETNETVWEKPKELEDLENEQARQERLNAGKMAKERGEQNIAAAAAAAMMHRGGPLRGAGRSGRGAPPRGRSGRGAPPRGRSGRGAPPRGHSGRGRGVGAPPAAAAVAGPSVPPVKQLEAVSIAAVEPLEDESHHFCDSIDLRQYTWYHGKISSSEADKRLDGAPKGSFLVRVPSKQGAFCISWVSEKGVMHSLVEKKGPEAWEMNAAGETRVWTSLPALLKDYTVTMPTAVPNTTGKY